MARRLVQQALTAIVRGKQIRVATTAMEIFMFKPLTPADEQAEMMPKCETQEGGQGKVSMSRAAFSALYSNKEFHRLVESYRAAYYDYKEADEEPDSGMDNSCLAEYEEDTALELARLVSGL